jgi:2-aminoethylphosphonate-pyruvate transaminase
LNILGVSNDEYLSVLMQGSGTFGNEACIQTMTPRDNTANYLIIENGAYGQRLNKICQLLDVKCSMLSFPEDRAVNVSKVEEYLRKNNDYTHIGVIHNETTAGVLNDVEAIGQLVKKYMPSKFLNKMSIRKFKKNTKINLI